MKPTILFCGYREWAIKIYDFINDEFKEKLDLKLVRTAEELKETIRNLNPDLIFFVGWSWIVEKEAVNKFKCICLHPSPLPKYRGGSPLQHQIIYGEKESAVTLFIMDENVDKGPIVWQEIFSLEGDLKDIFERIIEKGKFGMNSIISSFLDGKNIKEVPQDKSKATYYKRRNPEQSEIKPEDFNKYDAEELYNKIRALQDPYPNAFVVCKNNTKLYIQKAKIEEEK
jgi:methionyl-tRNA formyltransferase|tara:strand:- start:1794 stop:2474 length:681 start_codon:yes stop_codon:yes gene_type:complete